MSKVFNKNDYIEVTIEDIGGEGMGVAKASGYALFIKDALPGDTCRVRITKANKNYGFARVEEVIKESSLRVDPPCENAKRCGGCQIMAMDYEAQLQFKEKKVKD
ncbi:MAG: TRAM domain-containing protein, partial [Lachnospiraceae bacterium]|nr:TRAM domain-containing protein [Lachnospiraceae bacterium]